MGYIRHTLLIFEFPLTVPAPRPKDLKKRSDIVVGTSIDSLPAYSSSLPCLKVYRRAKAVAQVDGEDRWSNDVGFVSRAMGVGDKFA